MCRTGDDGRSNSAAAARLTGADSAAGESGGGGEYSEDLRYGPGEDPQGSDGGRVRVLRGQMSTG